MIRRDAMTPAPSGLLLHCREGFESDCAAEAMEKCTDAGVPGYCEARPGAAWLRFHLGDPSREKSLAALADWRAWIFARQCLLWLGEASGLPADDRVSALLAGLPDLPRDLGPLVLEHADTNTGKQLSRFCRRFAGPLRRGLEAHGRRLEVPAAPALHLLFTDSRHVQFGLGPPGRAAPWTGGIPRLRLSRSAPSRSALKLEEAFLTFFTREERARMLRPGIRAVDLGAAPGGWTYHLVRYGVAVTAVDNGPMAVGLMDSGLVEHVRADAFRYRPRRPVDLLVCDVVEQPHRISELMGQWLSRGDCGEAIFNLKLPMKQRFRHTRESLKRLQRIAGHQGMTAHLQCRQLYHDREEVTVRARFTRSG